MTELINYENSITNIGSWYRLHQLFDRARAGEKLNIGFIGGSITAGSVSTKPELCYAYRVFDWFCKTFPLADFQYINAGIGATDSQFGCARADEDLLCGKPDFVIVEFSVNDSDDEHYKETYEGLVRHIYNSETSPAVLIVHSVFYDSGRNAEPIHSQIAKYYHIPSVSMRTSLYPLVADNRIPARKITPDDLHPNDLGHGLVADVITRYLEKIAGNNENNDIAEFPAETLTLNTYEHSRRYRNDMENCIATGFVKDTETQEQLYDVFKNGWISGRKGDSLDFEVTGCNLSVMYRKTIRKPAPVAMLILDDDREHPIMLDANFEETWGDKLYLQTVLEHGANKVHRIHVEIVETHENDQSTFYFNAVLASECGAKEK